MILEGDQSVIDAIKEKKRLMEAGEEHGHIRPLLVCGGGATKVVYGLGALQALADQGYQDCFHTVVGISSGALAASYFLAGDLEKVEAVPADTVFMKRLLNVWRPFRVLDTAYLRTVIESDIRYKLDTDALFHNQTNFLIGISRFEDATPVLFSPTSNDELYESLRATISMAGAVSDPVYIRGARYLDGSTTLPHVRNQIHALPDVTHILDLTNQEQDARLYNIWEAILLHTLYRPVTNAHVRRAANLRRRARKTTLQTAIQAQATPLCVVWGDNSVGALDGSTKKLAEAAQRSRDFWLDMLAK